MTVAETVTYLFGDQTSVSDGTTGVAVSNCLCKVLGLPRAMHAGFSHVGLCTGWGDLAAMAITLCCDSPVGVREISCIHDSGAQACIFEVEEGALPETAWRVNRVLPEELDSRQDER